MNRFCCLAVSVVAGVLTSKVLADPGIRFPFGQCTSSGTSCTGYSFT